MTCIAGLIDSGIVYMGADSAGVAGYDLSIRADQKVFISGSFLMGFTTSFRMGQLLRYKLDPPKHPYTDNGQLMDEYKYMVTIFIDAVRQCLKDGGYALKDKEQEQGGTFLVGYRGRLFQVEDDYQVGELLDGFAAVGCGDQVALGSLYSTRGEPPVNRIRMALEAAERYSAGVRHPFVIERLGG
ncbi:MAG: hypothetical protein WC364_13495 [Eubacteriales bacterium]|jgi:hypothetical protein